MYHEKLESFAEIEDFELDQDLDERPESNKFGAMHFEESESGLDVIALPKIDVLKRIETGLKD